MKQHGEASAVDEGKAREVERESIAGPELLLKVTADGVHVHDLELADEAERSGRSCSDDLQVVEMGHVDRQFDADHLEGPFPQGDQLLGDRRFRELPQSEGLQPFPPASPVVQPLVPSCRFGAQLRRDRLLAFFRCLLRLLLERSDMLQHDRSSLLVGR